MSDMPHDEEAKLAEVLNDVPRGAWILSGSAVGLLLVLWLLFALFIVLGREAVG